MWLPLVLSRESVNEWATSNANRVSQSMGNKQRKRTWCSCPSRAVSSFARSARISLRLRSLSVDSWRARLSSRLHVRTCVGKWVGGDCVCG